jgi:small redox-active disulfide protein 2
MTTTTAGVRTIEVLGPGCARCHETYRVVRHVVEQAGLECTLLKSESYERIAELGVLRTPAIAIDGRVVLSGQVPTSSEVRRLLGLGPGA